MVFHRRTLSRATITAFTLLVMMVVLCQGQDEKVLVPLENQTVLVGSEAHFFCQIRGGTEQLWLNRKQIGDNLRGERPTDVTLNIMYGVTDEQTMLRIINVSLSVTASVERNNTEVICSDHSLGISKGSTAFLTVQGGPAEPEVEYGVSDDQREILLSWPRPFTWRDYPITGYLIECRDSQSELLHSHVNGTEIVNAPVVNQTVELPQDIPDCYSFQCSVTASNNLDDSPSSITNISLPLKLKKGHTNLSVSLRHIRFTKTSKPEVVLCVELPTLCEFQSVRYKVVISSGGDPVLQFTRVFSYSSGYSSQCIEEKVNDTLKEGTEYEVQVFLYAGESGNFSSNKTMFKPELLVENDDFFDSDVGKIVTVGVGTTLVVIVLVLTTIIILSFRRRKSSQHVVKAPVKRTTTPMVNNPIYDTETNTPFYEQVPSLNLKRLNSVSSHSNLDSPGYRAPSPANSTTTSASTRQLYRNGGGPVSPGSPSSNNSFSWAYAAVYPTNAATFDAIEADVENQLSAGQTLPPCTPGEESYMTMHSAANHKNTNNPQGQPRCAVDIHGNRYIEC